MIRSRRSLAVSLACLGWLSAVAGFAEASAASPASLLRFTALTDPPGRPPGDELTALVLLEPGVDEVDLEFQAIDVDPGPAAAALPVAGAPAASAIRYLEGVGEPYRDADGRFRMTAKASRPGGDALVAVVVQVPRSALGLDGRTSRLRYTATGRIGRDEVFFASAPPRPAAPVLPDQPPPALAIPQASPQFLPPPPVPSKAVPAPQAPVKAAPAPQAPARIAPAGQVPYSPLLVSTRRTIRFATNRDVRALVGTPSERFGDRIGDGVRYGSCVVNVPVERKPGTLPLPRPGAAGDPAREFFILRDEVEFLDEAAFRALVRGADAERDVLVYVNGFNTSFDYAAVRMAQVVEDLQFPGLPLLFSWPSHPVGIDFLGGYSQDETNADYSFGALARVFKTLVEEREARPAERRGRIHVLAHSLGNRVTMRALAVLDTMLPAGAKPMGQVVLAAPDVSVEEFARLQPSIARRAERVTLYFNPNDQALWSSFARHGAERRAGNSAQFLAGLDNVDSAHVDTSLLGHGYWSDSRVVLDDLHLVIVKGWGPARRVPEILRAFAKPRPYWAFAAGYWW